jgi:hypothetical protein
MCVIEVLQVGFEPPTLCSLVLQSVFFPINGGKYSMQVKLFMQNMWEFFLVFYFVPYKVNIPMHAGEIFYVFFLLHTKLIFPCMQGDLNKSYKEYIFWIQVKIHISDQTSLRICNSVVLRPWVLRSFMFFF